MSVESAVARTRSSATSAFAGQELGDFLEGFAPWFNEVVRVAPGQLDVFRVQYVVCDLFSLRERDDRVVGVLEDKAYPDSSRVGTPRSPTWRPPQRRAITS